MSNNFTPIMPVTFAQALMVLRESCIMPRLVNTDFRDVPAGNGDTVNVTIASAKTVSDVSPTAAPVQGGDSTPVKVAIPLNRWRKAGFYMTDKERGEIGMGQRPRELEETIRSLANDINGHILAQYKEVYGYVGTAGTPPFASDTSAAKAARLLLNQQLCPVSPRTIVLDPIAEANAADLAKFVESDKRGDQGGMLSGQIGYKMGMNWFMEHQVPTHTSTAFTAGAATVNGAQAAGAGSTDNGRTGTVSIAKASNAAPLVAGDVITFTGDTQTYTVLTGVSLIVGNTTVAIAPALRSAKAGGETVTLKATHVVNMAFHRDVISFASRRLSSEVASDKMISIADPVSGVVLRMEVIRQNKQDYFEFDVLYGAKCTRPELGVRIAG